MVTYASPGGEKNGGVSGSFREVTVAVLDYLHARITLLRIEAREATAHAGITAALAVGVLVVAVFFYLFLVLAGVAGLAAIFDGKFAWLWAMLIAALVHLGAAAVLLFLVMKRIKRPVFEQTIAELRKDKGWLKTKSAS